MNVANNIMKITVYSGLKLSSYLHPINEENTINKLKKMHGMSFELIYAPK